MSECTFAPRTTPIPTYLAHKVAEAYAASVIEDRLAVIRAAASSEHSISDDGADPASLEAMISALMRHSSNLTVPSAGGALSASSAAVDSPTGSLHQQQKLSSAGQVALQRSQQLREQMERELSELQHQWHAQEEARHSSAGGVMRQSQPGTAAPNTAHTIAL